MSENLPAVASAATPSFSVLEVKSQVAAMHKLFKDVMQRDVHYGTIPGTPKPTLFKAGAEKIGLLLRLAPSFEREMKWDGPHLTVISECTLIHGPTETLVAKAGAMCTSRETKYAYRQGTRKCPECGQAAIIKGKQEYGGGWLCFAKKGGCGAKWEDGDKIIEDQSEEREENPNLPDTYNTVMKMADKRAYVAATLFGTAASDIYTQDVEDFSDSANQPVAGAARITPNQHSRIAVLMKEKGVPLDMLRGWLNDEYGVQSRTELSESQAAAIIQRLEAAETGAPRNDTPEEDPPPPPGSSPDAGGASSSQEGGPFPLPAKMRNEETAHPLVHAIRTDFIKADDAEVPEIYWQESGKTAAGAVSDDRERTVVLAIASHYLERKVEVAEVWGEAF
ncbi:MAG: hypothetical protein V3W44_08665 [Dehalococcoidales bacterium]